MNNTMQMLQMIKGSNNPQQMIINMLQKNNNPMAQNIIQMVNNNDAKGIETLTRNICKSKGINPDEMINQLKKQL